MIFRPHVVDLNDSNFLLFAAKWYDSTITTTTELNHDIKRLRYLKRLFRKYKLTGNIKERLILNHIIILANVFGVENSVRLLFLKIDKKDWDALKTFLLFLQYIPAIIKSINGSDIISSNISVDMNLADILRKI